jgi:hypothetical protein
MSQPSRADSSRADDTKPRRTPVPADSVHAVRFGLVALGLGAVVLVLSRAPTARAGAAGLIPCAMAVASVLLVQWARPFGGRRAALALGLGAAAQAADVTATVLRLGWLVPLAVAASAAGLVAIASPASAHREGQAHPGRRRGRRWAVLTLAVAVLTASAPSASLTAALAGPGADPLSIRAVEWLRSNGGRAEVNAIEHWWYTRHQPPVGGVPSTPVGASSAAEQLTPPESAALAARPSPSTTRATLTAVTTDPAHGRPRAVGLARVPTPAGAPLPGEGEWAVAFGTPTAPSIATTEVRPDAVHTSLLVAIARIDPRLVRLRLEGGTRDPGPSWPSGGQVGAADVASLVAAFNSGFRLDEARGGYYADGRAARPLVAGAASLVLRTDGTATVGEWGRDAALGPDVAAVRQNLSLIVDGRAPVPGLADGNNRRWGSTLGHEVLVWRSGIGVTGDGALVWVGGPGLSISTLASTLVAAGAVRAMELDINSAWVAFFLYHHTAGGLAGERLLADMRHAPDRYLHPQPRDFIAVLSR